MFSPALGRVVRCSSAIPAPSACAFGRPAVLAATAQQALVCPAHQRRPSSSKASIPPNGSSENGSGSAQQSTAAASKAPARKASGKSARKRSSTPPALKVPHVPPTDYLQKPEVKISSFFSLHRPISLTSPIPPVSTNTSFDSIFKAPASNSRRAVADNIQTLANGIESLEAALRIHEQQAPEETIRVEAEVHHLDGPQQATLDRLMKAFVPFVPPPVPSPLDQTPGSDVATTLAAEASMSVAPVKQRAWSTEVVVTESTDATGKRTYSATTAPMVEISLPEAESMNEAEGFEIRQPFLERMRQRQIANMRRRDLLERPDMLAISVKRQRKLKMKKHKYKKLMKRTRLERRKLDRL